MSSYYHYLRIDYLLSSNETIRKIIYKFVKDNNKLDILI